jgi:DNA-binding NtrC family response regulator
MSRLIEHDLVAPDPPPKPEQRPLMPRRSAAAAPVLLVDDDAAAREALAELLGAAGYPVALAGSAAEARRVAEHGEPGLAVLDLVLPDGDGITLLEELRALWPGLPAIIVTGYVEPRSIVEAMRRGAVDYLGKPVDPEVFLSTCRGALGQRAPSAPPEPPAPVEVLGASATAAALREALGRLARGRPQGALISGEAGVGKTWAAHAVHAGGGRRALPCLVFPCGRSYAPSAALFGPGGAPARGSGPGGGLLAAAAGGTIVLDDVDRLEPGVAARLLEWIQQAPAPAPLLIGLVEPGAAETPLMAWLGRARLELPPLRERREDILPLARAFLAEAGSAGGRRGDGFSPRAEEALLGHAWPGNVRELREVVSRAARGAPRGPLRPEHVAAGLEPAAPAAPWSPGRPPRPLREVTDAYIDHVLALTGGNKTRAARLLGVARETLRTRMIARNGAE